MCGRYALTSPDELVAEFGLGQLPFSLKARYNIAPSQQCAVIVDAPSGAQLQLFRWGLHSPWVDDRQAPLLLNARAESVDEKPSFRDAFRRRRCLVCTDGFYEWKREGKRPVPHHMRRLDRRPFAMAGIWEGQDADGEARFTLLTTKANRLMESIHHRMPVIVSSEHYSRWLNLRPQSREQLQDLLVVPYAGDEYELFQVSEAVNGVGNDTADCLRPGPDQPSLF